MKISYLRAIFVVGALFAGADSARSDIEPEAAAPGTPALEHETVKKLLRARAAVSVEREDRAGNPPSYEIADMALNAFLADLERWSINIDNFIRMKDMVDRGVIVMDGSQTICHLDNGFDLLKLVSYLHFLGRNSLARKPLEFNRIVNELRKLKWMDAAIVVQIAIEDPLTRESAIKVEEALLEPILDSTTKPEEIMEAWVRDMDKLPSDEAKRLLHGFVQRHQKL